VYNSSHERSYPTSGPVSTGMGDRLWTGIPSRYVTSQWQVGQLSLALFRLGKGWNVTSAGWHVSPVAMWRLWPAMCNIRVTVHIKLLCITETSHWLGLIWSLFAHRSDIFLYILLKLRQLAIDTCWDAFNCQPAQLAVVIHKCKFLENRFRATNNVLCCTFADDVVDYNVKPSLEVALYQHFYRLWSWTFTQIVPRWTIKPTVIQRSFTSKAVPRINTHAHTHLIDCSAWTTKVVGKYWHYWFCKPSLIACS